MHKFPIREKHAQDSPQKVPFMAKKKGQNVFFLFYFFKLVKTKQKASSFFFGGGGGLGSGAAGCRLGGSGQAYTREATRG